MILPIRDFKGNSIAENIIWKKFKNFIPNDYISFHNYYIGIKQADVILLVPNRGVLIIEIKGYYAKNIIDVPDNSIIRLKNKPNETSPFGQAITYRNILMNDFLKPNSMDSVYVACSVCYPYLTKEEYEVKGLNKISHERLTITSEDLESECLLLNKIEDIFNLVYDQVHHISLDRYEFNKDLMLGIGNLISPNFMNDIVENIENKNDITENEKSNESEESEVMLEDISERKLYSRLLYVKDAASFGENKINELIYQWKSGINIYFYTSDGILLKKIYDRVRNFLDKMNLSDNEHFKFKINKTFLFNSGLIPELEYEFEIFNGEYCDKYSDMLNKLHNMSNFNKEQYEIEHAPLDNIIVKAGAGTGKTYSIMYRINYLIWEKKYSADDMRRYIAMITFTNDSADDMKRKLTENFENYYFITRNTNYLNYIESVENMNISTIHSMAKKVLQKYSSKLGYGKDFKIVTGNFNRSQILHRNLNKLVEDNPNIEKDIKMKFYFLEKRLLNFLDRLDNKNIDIVSDFNNLDFGVSQIKVFDKLIKVINDTQKEMSMYCQDKNTISLGDLIRKLRELFEAMKNPSIGEINKIDFLFVDEFQDTDDIQINIIKSFKDIFGYKLFVVGDIKQCIYRFRGAEVKAFDTLIKDKNETFINISLNKNYRTDKLLLDKLNDIFVSWNKNGDLEYSGDDILIGTKDYNKVTELHKVEHDEVEFEQKLIDNINESVSNLMKKGNKKNKVAILTRYNWQIEKIKDICEQNGINIDTDIGGGLFKIDPTIDLFKLVLALKYNRSAKYLYNLYTTSYVLEEIPKVAFIGKSEVEIVNYFYDNIPSNLKKWNKYILRLREEPVLKVIRDIVDDSKPWDIFARKAEAKGDEIEKKESYYLRNLDQLFENLVEASNTDFLTINKISDYLDIMIVTKQEKEARESYDLEKSVFDVICTTVHKSKGLEFDTVILPYCDFDISCLKSKGIVDLIYSENKIGYSVKGPDNKMAFQNDIYYEFQKDEIKDRTHEETRILYVALTRAIRKIVFFSKNDFKKPNKYWANIIGEV